MYGSGAPLCLDLFAASAPDLSFCCAAPFDAAVVSFFPFFTGRFFSYTIYTLNMTSCGNGLWSSISI